MPSFNIDWTSLTMVLDSTSAATSEPSTTNYANETATAYTSDTVGSVPTVIETAIAFPVGSAAMATSYVRFEILLQSFVLSLLMTKM